MADPGLLRLLPVVCMVLFLQTGCQHKAPRVAGQVVDAETGAGIEGVEVFRTVTLYDRLTILTGEGTHNVNGEGRSWTSTAPDGSFEIPDLALGEGRLRWRQKRRPVLTWVHRAYGWGIIGVDEEDLGQVEIRAERDPEQLEKMENPEKLYGWGPCDFHEIEPAHRCCEVAFGSADWCG